MVNRSLETNEDSVEFLIRGQMLDFCVLDLLVLEDDFRQRPVVSENEHIAICESEGREKGRICTTLSILMEFVHLRL